MIIDELKRAVSQMIVLSVIPFLWWSIRRFVLSKDTSSFFKWIGLKKPVIFYKKKFITYTVIALLVAISMSIILDPLLQNEVQLANEQFRSKGIEALIPAIIFSFFATGLPEEIFFRGFLGNRLSKKFGFLFGNTIQAILFGLLHGVVLISSLGVNVSLLVIIFTGTLGWLMGYVNEQADGSIIPSWCIHGVSNLYAAFLIMF